MLPIYPDKLSPFVPRFGKEEHKTKINYADKYGYRYVFDSCNHKTLKIKDSVVKHKYMLVKIAKTNNFQAFKGKTTKNIDVELVICYSHGDYLPAKKKIQEELTVNYGYMLRNWNNRRYDYGNISRSCISYCDEYYRKDSPSFHVKFFNQLKYGALFESKLVSFVMAYVGTSMIPENDLYYYEDFVVVDGTDRYNYLEELKKKVTPPKVPDGGENKEEEGFFDDETKKKVFVGCITTIVFGICAGITKVFLMKRKKKKEERLPSNSREIFTGSGSGLPPPYQLDTGSLMFNGSYDPYAIDNTTRMLPNNPYDLRINGVPEKELLVAKPSKNEKLLSAESCEFEGNEDELIKMIKKNNR